MRLHGHGTQSGRGHDNMVGMRFLAFRQGIGRLCNGQQEEPQTQQQQTEERPAPASDSQLREEQQLSDSQLHLHQDQDPGSECVHQ